VTVRGSAAEGGTAAVGVVLGAAVGVGVGDTLVMVSRGTPSQTASGALGDGAALGWCGPAGRG
jgi:hypothetical protein